MSAERAPLAPSVLWYHGSAQRAAFMRELLRSLGKPIPATTV